MIKLIVIGLLIAIAMAFLGTYEGLNLLYYEETKADRCTDYVAIPLLIYLAIALFVDKYRYSLKDNRILDAAKSSLFGVLGAVALYLFIVRPVISGAIVMTNDIFSARKEILITGKIVDKIEIRGPKSGNFELVIFSNNKELRLDTNGLEIKKYEIGQTFNEKMIKGIWGLMTKRK